MVKTATKPASQRQEADDTLVEDHGVDGLVLHQEQDENNNVKYHGTIQWDAVQVGFEATFDPAADYTKDDIRDALRAGAVTIPDGAAVPNHIAMNRVFKALLKHILNDLAEIKAQ